MLTERVRTCLSGCHAHTHASPVALLFPRNRHSYDHPRSSSIILAPAPAPASARRCDAELFEALVELISAAMYNGQLEDAAALLPGDLDARLKRLIGQACRHVLSRRSSLVARRSSLVARRSSLVARRSSLVSRRSSDASSLHMSVTRDRRKPVLQPPTIGARMTIATVAPRARVQSSSESRSLDCLTPQTSSRRHPSSTRSLVHRALRAPPPPPLPSHAHAHEI